MVLEKLVYICKVSISSSFWAEFGGKLKIELGFGSKVVFIFSHLLGFIIFDVLLELAAIVTFHFFSS